MNSASVEPYAFDEYAKVGYEIDSLTDEESVSLEPKHWSWTASELSPCTFADGHWRHEAPPSSCQRSLERRMARLIAFCCYSHPVWEKDWGLHPTEFNRRGYFFEELRGAPSAFHVDRYQKKGRQYVSHASPSSIEFVLVPSVAGNYSNMNECISPNESVSPLLVPSSPVDFSMKATKYSPEERRLRIERFKLKRQQQRNARALIRYPVKANLARTRQRVQGRFVRASNASPMCNQL
mmetsp:Transcript_17757/g.30600  ORF Transcript_17757/g.30600 Transcript_17757/m.30600 type:complete len:237 (-) Transcript_17757:408-1118(-)